MNANHAATAFPHDAATTGPPDAVSGARREPKAIAERSELAQRTSVRGPGIPARSE